MDKLRIASEESVSGYIRKIDFDQYLRQSDGDKAQKASNWQTAIGLQAVDGLKTSEYLHQTALRHIEGEIDIDEAGELLRTYYKSKKKRTPDEENMREADLVSRNIAKILSARTLDFSAEGYIAVHRKVFDGVLKFAGKVRDYDITKHEWVLGGDTVSYLNHEDLQRALNHDIQQEKEFRYNGLSLDKVVEHIAKFVSGLWQIHAFGEGNTRTTAVFCIQYLRSIGFNVDNSLFSSHSWYFRNALVRANYKNAKLGIDYDYSFLEKFFRNLLIGEHNELKNRYLHIDSEQVPNKYRTSTEQVPNKFVPESTSISNLIAAIGDGNYSVKEMMECLDLKHRPTFIYNYLQPSIENAWIDMLYPGKPNHPRQRYKLTVKALSYKASR